MKSGFNIAIALTILLSGNCFSQPVISPNPSFATVDSEEFETVAYSDVNNTSEFDRNLTWTRTEIAITEGWTTAICDLNICHLGFISSASFLLPAGESGTLDVHLYPAGIVGSAVIQVVVHDSTDPTFADTAFYFFSMPLSNDEISAEAVSIYPNPFREELVIEHAGEVDRVQFYSLDGKLVYDDRLNNDIRIKDPGLSSGMYLLRMFDKSGTPYSARLVKKI